MSEITVDADFVCDECGEDLEVETRKGLNRVLPCQVCINKAHVNARAKGYSEGYNYARSKFEGLK